MSIPQFLTDTTLLGASPLRWLIALAASLLVLALLSGLRSWIRARLERREADHEPKTLELLLELVGATRNWALLVVAAFAFIYVLALDPVTTRRVSQALIILLLVQGALWANTAIDFLLRRYSRDEGLDGGRRTSLAALGFMGRLLVYSLLLLMALDNLGVNITALIAGLGVGSIAVALAVQGILTDLFASLSIIFDKPFEIGDFIVVDGLSGTVENIGLRTTRLRALSGEQLVFANADLLESRVHNYKRMAHRRIVFRLGVEHGTPRGKLEQIPRIIREELEGMEGVRFDRSHFSAIGETALEFETVYIVLSRDYGVYMDLQQRLNLALYERISALGVSFALPARTVHLSERKPVEVVA